MRSRRFIGSLPLVVSTIIGAWLGGALAEPLLAATAVVALAGYWLVSARAAQRRGFDRWFLADALPFTSGVWIWRFLEFAVLVVIALNWHSAMSIGVAGVAGARALWGSSGLVPAVPLLKEELHHGSNDGNAPEPQTAPEVSD